MKNLLYTLIFASASFAQAAEQKSGEMTLSIDARDELGAIDDFIEGRKELLAIQGKEFDMFGRPQDPKKAKLSKQKKVVAVVQPKPTIPLQRILDALPVTMIDPMGDRVVLSGVPPLSKGETLELAFQGQTVVLRFEGSRSTGAYFREMKSKKLGLRKMTRLPKGIKQGSHGQSIAGGIHEVDTSQPKNIKLDLNLPGGPGPD
ncbi:MAG: hypothetical protein ACSHYB_13445 [Roseibacillus sp.]